MIKLNKSHRFFLKKYLHEIYRLSVKVSEKPQRKNDRLVYGKKNGRTITYCSVDTFNYL